MGVGLGKSLSPMCASISKVIGPYWHAGKLPPALPMVSFHLRTPGFGKKRGGRAFIQSMGVTHSVPLRVSNKYSFEQWRQHLVMNRVIL